MASHCDSDNEDFEEDDQIPSISVVEKMATQGTTASISEFTYTNFSERFVMDQLMHLSVQEIKEELRKRNNKGLSKKIKQSCNGCFCMQ